MIAFPDDAALLSSVVELTLQAVEDYVATARGACAWDVPEHWVQAKVKCGLDAKYGLNIWMERPVTALLKDICAEPSPDLRRGFFDLTVYETSTGLPKDDNFRGIVEIKMGIKGYECLPDANRIRAIGKVCEPLCGIVAGMFIRDAKPVVDCMSESLQIEAREIVYRLASKPDIAGYSYGAVGALLQRSSPASTTLALWH